MRLVCAALLGLLALAPAARADTVALVAQATSVATFNYGTGVKGPEVPLGGQAQGVAISPDGRTGYVAVSGAAPRVQFVDLAAGTATDSVPLPGSPSGLALSPDGSKAYVTDETADLLRVVDLAGKVVLPLTWNVGDTPRAVVLNPAGNRAYTGNAGTPPSVSSVDLSSTGVANITGGGLDRPENLSVSPDGKTVWAANFGASAGGTTVTPIDTATGTAGSAITVGTTPAGLAVDPQSAKLFVANRDTQTISVVGTAGKAVSGTFTLPPVFPPSGVAVTPGGDRAVVSSREGDQVRVISLFDGVTIGEPVAFTDPTDVAIAPAAQPTAIFIMSVASARAGTAVSFNAGPSGGDITNFSWSFDDGATATGFSTTHAFATPGTHSTTLTVTNTCAETAVFGPAGSVWGGVGALCSGPRTDAQTRTIQITPIPPGTATVRILSSKASVRRKTGAFVVRLRCTTVDTPNCKGTATLVHKKKTIATRAYDFRNGQTLKVRLRLNARGRKAIKKRKKFKALLTAATVQPSGSVSPISRTLSLRAVTP
jgi:DNA-binding beta-propeller fold protein YncE